MVLEVVIGSNFPFPELGESNLVEFNFPLDFLDSLCCDNWLISSLVAFDRGDHLNLVTLPCWRG